MKKFISLFTTFCIVFAMIGTFTVFSDDTDITEISTLAELEAFRDDVNNGNTYEGKTVKLTADIDMSEKYGEGKESWTPIGSWDYPFCGTFDGGNHTISGLYISTGEEYACVALFVVIEETLKNLNVKGYVFASDSNACAAGIAATVNEGGSVIECSFDGTIKCPNYNAVGIAASNDGLISGCKFKGKVEGQHLVGGIAGTGNGTIENCVNEGEITATFIGGGIAGWQTAIKNCINKGSVTGRTSTFTDPDGVTHITISAEIGGIVGTVYNNSVVENCYNTGAVTGNSEVGGILGVASLYYGTPDDMTLVQVKNCYNTGKVTSTMEKQDSEHNTGAIIGSREFNKTEDGKNFTKVLTSEAVDCYYLSGTADKGCGGIAEDTATALTAEQFADKSNFANWDFDTVWDMDETLSRPVVRSNREQPPVTPMASPTASPTVSPAASPTTSPTVSPAASPTTSPTASPTVTPTAEPTPAASPSPTASPTAAPISTPKPDFEVSENKLIYNGEKNNTVFLIFAKYSGNSLETVILEKFELKNKAADISAYADFDKIFIWNGINSMQPLSGIQNINKQTKTGA